VENRSPAEAVGGKLIVGRANQIKSDARREKMNKTLLETD